MWSSRWRTVAHPSNLPPRQERRGFDPRRSRLEHYEAFSGILVLPPGAGLPDWWRHEAWRVTTWKHRTPPNRWASAPFDPHRLRDRSGALGGISRYGTATTKGLVLCWRSNRSGTAISYGSTARLTTGKSALLD
jgi:hypothetical protein